MYWKLLVIIASAATLSSCVSNDPRKGGFFGGLQGLNSGAYDARIDQRNEELGQQENLNQGLKDKSSTLQGKARTREAKLAAEQELLDDMDENLNSLESDIENLNAKSAKQETEIASLKVKIADQRRKFNTQQKALKEFEQSGASTADPERYRILQQERNRLADEYSKLLKYFQALANATK